jgi:hypothetical protein
MNALQAGLDKIKAGGAKPGVSKMDALKASLDQIKKSDPGAGGSQIGGGLKKPSTLDKK